MLPALDMLNHTRVAQRRNSSLQQSHEAMTVRRGDADVAFTGHFSMAAGEFTAYLSTYNAASLVPACAFASLHRSLLVMSEHRMGGRCIAE